MSDELAGMTLCELAPRIRARKVSPVEVTRAVLDRIERFDPVLNAYIAVDAEGALKAARTAQRRIAAGIRRRAHIALQPEIFRAVILEAGRRTEAAGQQHIEPLKNRQQFVQVAPVLTQRLHIISRLEHAGRQRPAQKIAAVLPGTADQAFLVNRKDLAFRDDHLDVKAILDGPDAAGADARAQALEHLDRLLQ